MTKSQSDQPKTLVALRCESCWKLLARIAPADLPSAGAGPWDGTLNVVACSRCTVRNARRWWDDGDAGRHLEIRLQWAELLRVVQKAWATGKVQDVKVRVATPPADNIE